MRALSILSWLGVMVMAVGLTHGVAAVPTNRVCLNFNSIYYDIRVGQSGTILERWSNGQMLDSNWYAKLNKPVPQNSMWGEGVAYAATMQTRHVWINMEPNTPAYWDVVNGEDIWRYTTTINGVPQELVFRTSNCVVMTAAPPTPAPPTVDPNAPRRVCGQAIQYYYDITTSPSGTVMKRWDNLGRLVDTNTFASLHSPPAPGVVWSEGIVFAATMQTRFAWFNMALNSPAYWDVVNGEDIWRFATTVQNNLPYEQVFRSSLCVVMTTPPPTPVPDTTVRVCHVRGNIFYEIRTGVIGTILDRRNYPSMTLIDTNWFATLHKPVFDETMWGEGVAYAATMQTRHVWVNEEPNPTAYWQIYNNEDHFFFNTVINGVPQQLVFRTLTCTNALV